MSSRSKFAITYGVLSILNLGIALGLTFAGVPQMGFAWFALALIQIMFLFIVCGYSAGRYDQYHGLVTGKPE